MAMAVGSKFIPLHTRYEVMPNGCWRWTSTTSQEGYGIFQVGGRKGKVFKAHRYFYEFFKSARIPDGMTIDHLCRNKACVNPQHLEVVTSGENSRRAGPYTVNANKTKCKHGHPLSGDNLRIDAAGKRVCITCKSIKSRASYLRRRDICKEYYSKYNPY
jgi:hypothetical protein